MAAKRGFGVAGALEHAIVGPLAAEVERLGYATFWTNDTPAGDGLAALAAAAASTSQVRLAVGVIPVDRSPAERIIERVAEQGLPVDRLLVGIGAGGTKVGSLEMVRSAATTLRTAGFAVAIAALGPKMVRLTGEVADAALFNWQTPEAAADMAANVASAAGRSVEPIGYVRVAYGPGSAERLVDEANRYAAIPAYAAHFARYGVRAIDTCVQGDERAAIDRDLSAFGDSLSEVVARAITGEETFDAYLALARAAAP